MRKEAVTETLPVRLVAMMFSNLGKNLASCYTGKNEGIS